MVINRIGLLSRWIRNDKLQKTVLYATLRYNYIIRYVACHGLIASLLNTLYACCKNQMYTIILIMATLMVRDVPRSINTQDGTY